MSPKQICMKCKRECCGGWTMGDERHWTHNAAIQCPDDSYRDLSDEIKPGGYIEWPPKNCRYQLEQLIAVQKNVE